MVKICANLEKLLGQTCFECFLHHTSVVTSNSANIWISTTSRKSAANFFVLEVSTCDFVRNFRKGWRINTKFLGYWPCAEEQKIEFKVPVLYPPPLGVKPEYWFRGQTIKEAMTLEFLPTSSGVETGVVSISRSKSFYSKPKAYLAWARIEFIYVFFIGGDTIFTKMNYVHHFFTENNVF